MNWKSIEKNNKKAFSKLIFDWNIKTYKCTEFEFLCNSASQNHSANIIVNDRDLYDFFDDNKIYVVVQRDWDAVSECDTTEWYYDISVGEINTEHGAGVWFENRKDCEVIAFERAFIILEEKL